MPTCLIQRRRNKSPEIMKGFLFYGAKSSREDICVWNSADLSRQHSWPITLNNIYIPRFEVLFELSAYHRCTRTDSPSPCSLRRDAPVQTKASSSGQMFVSLSPSDVISLSPGGIKVNKREKVRRKVFLHWCRYNTFHRCCKRVACKRSRHKWYWPVQSLPVWCQRVAYSILDKLWYKT